MRIQAQAGNKYLALVVDDDRTSLELSCAMLAHNGFMADKACSGSEAFVQCKTHVYDIIFMDIEMPNLDGYETVKAIRRMNKGAVHAHIIALSGHLKNKDQVQKCLEAGMNDCMAKPLNLKILEKKIFHWVQKKK